MKLQSKVMLFAVSALVAFSHFFRKGFGLRVVQTIFPWHETIQIDKEPYLTRFYLGVQTVPGDWKSWRFMRPNARELGEGRALFLHFFHKSDQGRELHNHPYTGTSLILKGGYYEERMSSFNLLLSTLKGSYQHEGFTEVTGRMHISFLRAAFNFLIGKKPLILSGGASSCINHIGLEDFHRTELLYPASGCWTLFLTGPRVKAWGFLNRNTLDFFPYQDKKAMRIGSGPHSRDAQGTREERDEADRKRREFNERFGRSK